jgi:signal transduction histidine kinase
MRPSGLLESVLNDVGVGLAIVDQSGHIALVNQATIDMLGGEDPTGHHFTKLREVYRVQDLQGNDIPLDQAPIMRALRGEAIQPQDTRVVLPDGRVKWLHTASYNFAVFGLTGVFVIIADETKQADLRRATELLQRLEAMGQLTRGLLHDFNNMLFVSSSSLALALNDEGLSETTRHHLQQATLALQKGASLARRLSQFSRTEHIEPRPVHMNAAVAAALELVRPLMNKRVRVKLELHPELPSVEADPNELEQVIVNLILNALDAMPEGGELTLRTEVASCDPLAHAGTGGSSECVLISVIDTGIGIPEHLHARIFEPFFTTKPDSRGTGLGLSSAYGIVHQHGGEITVQSAPGAGSTFRVYLPVKAAAQTSKEAA